MKRLILVLLLITLFIPVYSAELIVDHNSIEIDNIPDIYIEKAKDEFKLLSQRLLNEEYRGLLELIPAEFHPHEISNTIKDISSDPLSTYRKAILVYEDVIYVD